MKRKITVKKITGTEQGTVWEWCVKEGCEVIFGGYGRTKKVAINDACIVGGSAGLVTKPTNK